jgi:glycosyltransferase involved in cell wall biosynthesis
MLFEIRIPTCERPDMLRRALESLVQQTYANWRAVIFDDSPTDFASKIVNELKESRITYLRNKVRLGAATNIDQCFAPNGFSGSDYACLLEDDNFWLPRNLEVIANRIKQTGSEIILINQRINQEGKGLLNENETTRGEWFSDGEVSPLLLRTVLLFNEGISNGGLVWKLNGRISLQVGDEVKQTGLHEACRSLLMKQPFQFIYDAQSVWTFMPKSETARATEANRLIGRGIQSIRSWVVKKHGRDVLEPAYDLALKKHIVAEFAETLAYIGVSFKFIHLARGGFPPVFRALTKGWALRLIQPDPCAEFFRSKGPLDL